MLLLKNIPKNHFPNNKDVPIRNDHFYADKYLQRYGSRDRNGGRKLGFRGDGRGDEGSDEEDDEVENKKSKKVFTVFVNRKINESYQNKY